ncbi:MBL fold metallo-hydrolase [Eleftheria terrae]|uniref:MBL fold metallo-hydrolase n=1 Tax=Eleftheria terrae TaxID=1597781 RepID=UPI00263B523B|nr:MBL fold metallo-hydrolase [Eleftheria terrae]WKB54845.1 MBL fold metallo-hydrolase [Eleftheria terrae]
MNELEQRLQYPLGEQLPEPGHTLEVAPGVRWVRMGLPFVLNHINLWLLRDEIDGVAGWTVVDCGITDDTTRATWEQVFEHELQGLPVLRVVVTHMHPDHIGLAHWLTERWGCRLWISATDYNAARIASQSTTGYGGEAAARFFASHGLTDPEAVAKVRARSNYYASMVPQVPPQYRRLIDGLALSIGGHGWRCIAGYGHAPEHISLYSETLGVMISGDMLLPRISTNISVFDVEPEGNPLPLYLASLTRLRELMPDDVLVLPAHGRPFRGVHERVAQLVAHHQDRLDEVRTACRQAPCSAAELLPVMFKRQLDLHQTTFAMGEAVAHLHALWLAGELRRTTGPDGVHRFAAGAAA